MRPWLQRFISNIKTIVGIPDYHQYLQHMKKYHSEQTPLSEKDFFRQNIEQRYGGKTMRRCC